MIDRAQAEARVRGDATSGLGVRDAALVLGEAPFPEAVWSVGALAVASVTAFADELAALLPEIGGGGDVAVDRALVGEWFRAALRPADGSTPRVWDAIAGDYRTRDGWIRLHTNAPRHRAAALRVLEVAEDREAVAATVLHWRAEDLELAVVEAGGAAAAMRSAEAWAAHQQGAAVAAEPLVRTDRGDAFDAGSSGWRPQPGRPLAGLRVLDLTRVLAGPVATRALAAFGATVLRIDPPDWDEPAVVPDMTLGKRAARLDARTAEGRGRLHDLLASADVLVHGYRRDALDALGLGDADRHRIRPGLIDVALTAYGWTGPWSARRGFDSLVQMSAGTAERGMRLLEADRPVPLPVQGLDHATGWLMAAAALAGVRARLRDGRGTTAQLSLARTAVELAPLEPGEGAAPASPPPSTRIDTPWGPQDLVRPPISAQGVPFRFDAGPTPLGADAPTWPDASRPAH